MTDAGWLVEVDGVETTVVFDPCPVASDAPVFVCAHGAGGSYDDRGVVRTTQAMREQGLGTVRFNFLYRQRRSGRPDPMPKLMACYAAVVARVREELSPARLVIGGRSMGGRVASMMAADGFDADGLLLLAYPLHPPGRPEKLRDAHLPQVVMPTLCISGTRDDFCTKGIMDEVVARLTSTFRMHWIEGADHSFHVLKSSGRTDSEVMNEIAGTARDWAGSSINVATDS
jgi:hypothetical protein